MLIGDLVHVLAELIGLRSVDFDRRPDDSPLAITHEPYVVRKSRTDGERDLVRLAKDVPEEGAWYFLSDTQEWYHVSEDAGACVGENGLELYTKERFSMIGVRRRFSAPGRLLIQYHTHPVVESVAEELSARLEQDNVSGRLDVDLLCKTFVGVNNGLPSALDVDSAIFSKYWLQKYMHTVMGIGSASGITTCTAAPLRWWDRKKTVKDYESARELLFGYLTIVSQNDVGVAIADGCDMVNRALRGRVQLSFTHADEL